LKTEEPFEEKSFLSGMLMASSPASKEPGTEPGVKLRFSLITEAMAKCPIYVEFYRSGKNR